MQAESRQSRKGVRRFVPYRTAAGKGSPCCSLVLAWVPTAPGSERAQCAMQAENWTRRVNCSSAAQLPERAC